MFLNEDLTFTNSQRASSKRIVKFTKRAQNYSNRDNQSQKSENSRKSIEFLIFLNFETTYIEQKDALFVNKYVFSQLNHFDSFINAFSFTNLSISKQNFSELIVVDASNFFFDSIFIFVFTFVSAFVSILETTFISAHQ